jgi:hypothetical protein
MRIAWSGIWLQLAFFASIAASKELLSKGVAPPGIYSWFVAIVPVILAPFVLRSYMLYIGALDDLWIKIYSRAMAFTFGVTVLALFSYPILELANAPKLEAFYYAAFSILVFCGSAIYCYRRYV